MSAAQARKLGEQNERVIKSEGEKGISIQTVSASAPAVALCMFVVAPEPGGLIV